LDQETRKQMGGFGKHAAYHIHLYLSCVILLNQSQLFLLQIYSESWQPKSRQSWMTSCMEVT